MNSRERRMLLALGVCLVGAAVFAAHALVYTPIQDLKAEAEKVENDISVKQALLDKVFQEQKRTEAAKKRSLPADADLARVEYDLMMRKLLSDAGVPQGYTIVPRESIDTRSIPVFDPKTKKPVYNKIGFEIHMKKVDLATLAKFLHAYYRLNLLQQITFLNIVRKDQDGGAGARAKAGDRTDLDVKMHTEAVILDGAQDRQTLLPISVAKAAVGGGPGYAALLNTREIGRGVTPLQLADVLASAQAQRDYLHMTGRDFIHGPLPPPPPPILVDPVVAKVPEKPKEDISPFIKLTGAFVGSDGIAEASVWDQANNQLYVITLKPKGERYEVKVEKMFLVNEKWKRVLDGLWTELVIHEDDTATSRKFKVVGLDGLDLVLTETRTLAPEPTKSETGKPRPGAKPAGKMPTPPPSAAVVGGSAVALAPAEEKVYVWRVGQTLQVLTALPAKDAEEALRRAAPSFRTAVTEPSSPTSAPLSKID